MREAPGTRIRRRPDGVYEILCVASTMRTERFHQLTVVTGMTLLAVPLAATLASLLPGLLLEIPPLTVTVGLVLLLRVSLTRRRPPRPTLRVIDCNP